MLTVREYLYIIAEAEMCADYVWNHMQEYTC